MQIGLNKWVCAAPFMKMLPTKDAVTINSKQEHKADVMCTLDAGNYF